MARSECTHRGRKAAGLFAVAALLLGGALLSGCSTNIGEMQFPSVNDTTRQRTGATLTDAERQKAEQELTTARDSVEARAQQNAQSTTQYPDTTGSTTAAAAPRGTAGQAGGGRSP